MEVARTKPQATSLATPPPTHLPRLPEAHLLGRSHILYRVLPRNHGTLADSVSCPQGVGKVETRTSVPVLEPFPGKQESWTQQKG